MPRRKFSHLEHLSPEEYRKESMKRRDNLRKEYHQSMYIDRVTADELVGLFETRDEAVEHC
jgi:hypothetical protein